MIERKFVSEYDVLLYLSQSGGRSNEQEIADHFGIDLDRVKGLMNRLMMMGFVGMEDIKKTALGQAKVDQMEAELADAGDIFSPDSDYRLCEQAGYLYASGWRNEDGINSPCGIAMMLSLYRSEEIPQ